MKTVSWCRFSKHMPTFEPKSGTGVGTPSGNVNSEDRAGQARVMIARCKWAAEQDCQVNHLGSCLNEAAKATDEAVEAKIICIFVV